MQNKIVPILFETYLAVIKNSPGSQMFRNLYAKVGDEKKDIVENGNLSCAFFTSSLLLMFGLIKSPHATVEGTVKDLLVFGWQPTEENKPGCVLVWEKIDQGGTQPHKHIGFYIDNNEAISNDSKSGMIQKHHYEFDGQRKVELKLWHPKLDLEK
jgi:hypothetical protein